LEIGQRQVLARLVLEAYLGQGARLLEHGQLDGVGRHGFDGTRCGSRLANTLLGREKLRSVSEAKHYQQADARWRRRPYQQPTQDPLCRHRRCPAGISRASCQTVA
jgi:hypothetical protein